MRRSCFCLFLILPLLTATPGRGQDYFQQDVAYVIRASLDTASHRLTGSETIRYTNNSPDTLTEFYLHLYPNAYQSKETAFMRDYRRRFNVNLFSHFPAYRSRLDVDNVRVDGAAVSVDVDDTLARFDLPSPLPPGASMEIALDFDHRIRKQMGRAGWRGDQYDMAQWYPKVVVYDDEGFHDDVFVASAEFYGEFGTYDVHLDVPADHVVAATGLVVSGDPGWGTGSGGGDDGRKTVHFRAERVHDFAWCSSPHFVVQDTTWNGVEIRSFYQRRHAGAWKDSTLAHGVRALEWLTEKVGPYAYPQVSIVDANLGGGMEYPMLVMNGPASESLVFHEVGHIYFYGLLANNEREEAWMDEGFTRFQTQWYKVQRYGPWGDRSRLNWYQRITPQRTIWENHRRVVHRLDRLHYAERISTRGEDFKHSYRTNVYVKATLMLRALRYVVGAETFEDILRTYYERWQFKHVDEAKFVAVAEEVSGMDLSLFFEQWLHTIKTCDYRLERFATRENPDGGYTAGVDVRRDGEMVIPVTLHFTLEDGSVETRRIDSRLRTIKESYDFASRPVAAAINPDNEINDIFLADNFYPRRRDLQFDWPGNDYYPENAYQIRWRPGVWYNDVDGAKAGLLLRGSHQNWSKRFRLGVYYGAESDRVDFTASWDKRFRIFGSNSNFHLSTYKMEGRRDFTTQIDMTRRRELTRPPSQRFRIGFNYHELTNPRYLTSPEIYDTSLADLGPYIGYTIDPQLDVASTEIGLQLRFGREWFSGKYQYERLAAHATMKSRRQFSPVDVRLRLFLGLLGGNAPTQEKFSIAGAGPLEQEKHYYLRSPRAMWDDLNYHLPGDGNLRGYRAGTFGVNRLFSLNTEIGTRLRLWWLERLTKPLLGNLSWHGFFDLGRIYDSDNPIGSSTRVQKLVDGGILDETLMDAGIGFVSRKKFPFYDMTLRLDLPLWLNNPQVIGESEETDFRYLLSLQASF